MKSVITTICVLIPLVILFIIIDRKDFHSGNDVAVQQEAVTGMKPTTVTMLKPIEKPMEAKPAETKKPAEKKPVTETKPATAKTAETKPVAEKKPAETKPATTKPVESKPVETKKPLETKQAEAKPTETKPVAENKKPAETKQTEAKPAETKPVAEKKPVDAKPVVETKPATAKSAETKPTTTTKPMPAPAAVPVVTAEEAEKLNAEAIEYAVVEKEKREPFFRMYQNSNLDNICFEGTIRATSSVPDPNENDYDNCLYALFVELDSVLTSNTPISNEMPCEAIIVVPIMKDKRLIEENIFFPGDRIHCNCEEYDKMPLEIQRIQLSDDIQAFDHQQFFTIEVSKVKHFATYGNRNFAKREITILPIQTLSKDENAARLRNNRIQTEISLIEKEVKKHGGSFESWKKEYKPIGEKYAELCNKGWKGWINDSFYAAYGDETKYQTKAYIDGILPYKKYLEANNIDLIVLRIPSKGDFAARVLAAEDFQENPAWVEHYYECLRNDIEIIDPMPEMWKHRFDYPLFYFFHPDSEFHPFEGQAFISAQVLSDVLRRYHFSPSDVHIDIEDYSFKTKETRFFWPEGNDKFDPNQNVVFKQVVQNKETIGSLSVNSGSPFLFLSNSFFWFPRGSQGASVPGYTAYLLQHIPDWFYQDGTTNPLIRMLVNTPEALQKRHAVIMVGYPGAWNGSFPVFPKYLLDKPNSISLEKTLDFISSDVTNLDNGSFLFVQEDGVTAISPNPTSNDAKQFFEIELDVPKCENKDTCMLRINFTKTNFLSIHIYEPNRKKVIDSATMSLPNSITPIDLSPDFFINASTSQKIVIRFSSKSKFSIKNIELWYY